MRMCVCLYKNEFINKLNKKKGPQSRRSHQPLNLSTERVTLGAPNREFGKILVNGIEFILNTFTKYIFFHFFKKDTKFKIFKNKF